MQFAEQPVQLLIDLGGRNAEIAFFIHAHDGATRLIARFCIDNCLEFHVPNSVFVCPGLGACRT